MVKPTFLLIGTQKSGTDSARFHLNCHPDIFMPNQEFHYFDSKSNIPHSNNGYEMQFKTNKAYVGEKTPSYCYLRFAIDRIYTKYPNMKLIFILREPIARAYSQYNMENKDDDIISFIDLIKSQENISLDKILSNGQWNLQRGFYMEQIEYILTKFPRENLYIAIAEEIKEHPLDEYNKMIEFIGASKMNNNDFVFCQDIHKTKYFAPISNTDALYMHNIYSPHNEKLYQFLGRRIDSWENTYIYA